jgi:hypothetical protein
MSQDSITRTPAGAAVAGQARIRVPHLAFAAVATTQYQDVFVRDNFGDTGVIPSTGMPWGSPDIIPFQGNILSGSTAATTYNGPDIGMPFVQPGTNNLYVRALNLCPTATERGAVQLYYSPSSLMMSPSLWINNQVLTAGGGFAVGFVNQAGSLQLNPNDICITAEAFSLSSLPSNPQGGHYCLVAVVSTSNTTVTIPSSFSSNAAFAQWVQNNPAVAWRNITVVPNTVPQILQTMTFGSDDNNAGSFHFRVVGQNLPVGTTVVAQCTNVQCIINQSLAMPAPDPNGNQFAGWDQSIPGNFQSALTFTVTPPAGQSFSPNSSLATTYYQYPPDQPTQLHMDVGRFAQISRMGTDAVSRTTTQFMIQLGQCNINFVNPG